MKSYLLLFILAFLSSCQRKEKTLDEMLLKSTQWLWAQQSPDGGWHSETHAVLRDGKVLTPYLLYYLLQLPENKFPRNQNAINNAVDFITREINAAFTEEASALKDYPNYSAAYALRVLHFLQRDTSLQKKIADYLIEQQFAEHRGFTADHLVYGGWGYGEPNLKPGEHGHVDISHTRRVLEALNDSGYLNDSLSSRAKRFIKGVQRAPEDFRKYEGVISRSQLPYDGGFIASTVTLSTNKSEPITIDGAGIHYPSYATATCDGLMAMHALKMNDDVEYHDALKWLNENNIISKVAGLKESDPGQWSEIMHYYHLAVRSEVMSLVKPGGSRGDSIAFILIKEQKPDGSYINPIGGVNKEDDPFLATLYCIQAGWNVLSKLQDAE